jgi:CheY-like chemotaxis protein
MPARQQPLVLVASEDPHLLRSVVASLAEAGYAALAASSAGGCLRLATASGPDLILLDERLPRRVDGFLRAHPTSRRARLVRLAPRALPALCLGLAAGLALGLPTSAPPISIRDRRPRVAAAS